MAPWANRAHLNGIHYSTSYTKTYRSSLFFSILKSLDMFKNDTLYKYMYCKIFKPSQKCSIHFII